MQQASNIPNITIQQNLPISEYIIANVKS